MTSSFFADADEPPLSTLPRTRGQILMASLRRRAWIYRKLARHAAEPVVRLSLVPLLLLSLTPATAIEAVHAAGPTSAPQAQLADFTFESITPDEESAGEFIDKPLILATDIGRPERELREREAAERERVRRAREAAARRTQVTRATRVASTQTASQPAPARVSSAGNGYIYGYCTYWAKTRRPDIPNSWGNANAWLGSARRAGWATGSTPQAGAIVVTAESRLGHVGYVEAVVGDEIIVSDMNVIGWNKTSTRHMKISSGVIRGYIY